MILRGRPERLVERIVKFAMRPAAASTAYPASRLQDPHTRYGSGRAWLAAIFNSNDEPGCGTLPPKGQKPRSGPGL